MTQHAIVFSQSIPRKHFQDTHLHALPTVTTPPKHEPSSVTSLGTIAEAAGSVGQANRQDSSQNKSKACDSTQNKTTNTPPTHHHHHRTQPFATLWQSATALLVRPRSATAADDISKTFHYTLVKKRETETETK